MAGKSSKWAEINENPVPQAKSLHTSRKVSNLYGTEIEIWASLGLVGIANTEKKIESSNIWERFLYVFMVIFFLNIAASILKSCIKWRFKKLDIEF